MRFKVGDAVTVGADGHRATIEALSAAVAVVRTDEGLREEVPLANLSAPMPEPREPTADGTILGE